MTNARSFIRYVALPFLLKRFALLRILSARVVELVDTLVLEASAFGVQVQVLSRVPLLILLK